jgi:hypothetical protein
MTRKRKLTEQATATLEELPRDPEELTPEEAEAAKGGMLFLTPSMAAGVAAALANQDFIVEDTWDPDALADPF